MNTWFRRAVGTVGVAGGILLLGAGAAHADDTALAPGQLDDLLSPAGGPNNQSLRLDTYGERIDMGAATAAEAGRRPTSANATSPAGQQVPDLLSGLPLSTLLPTNSVGLPRTTSSRVPKLPGLPTGGLTEDDTLAGLPLVGSLSDLDQLGLPSADALQGTSIADSRTAFPRVPSPRKAQRKATAATEGLPVVGGLPRLGGGLPVHGTLKPIDDFGIPLGESTEAAEAGGLPVVGDMPLGGSDVLKNDSVTGLPVIGGVGPTSGVSTTAVANRLVPTTGALPQTASRLPLVAEMAYAPKHSTMDSPKHAEALPVVGGLPLVGGLTGGGLPLLGGLPVLGG